MKTMCHDFENPIPGARGLLAGGARLFLAVCLVSAAGLAVAQDQPDEGINSGNYNIHQSIEFGGRITDYSGNGSLWNTFVNLYDGPRLLEHTLQMRSLNHQGTLFDDLYVSSFGYGGDPNNVTRLKVTKNKWYNFTASFRRDRNFWDYNLLANPLNPDTSVPAVPIDFSPHRFEVVRRISDFDLILRPQDRFRIRLGYGQNVSEGPSFSSFHEGTDVLVFQDWRQILHSYRIGFDFKFLPRTNISYDQFFNYQKGDNSYTDGVLRDPRLPYFAQCPGAGCIIRLPDGTTTTVDQVDLGLILDTAANSPCATPINDFTTTPQTANPTCNGYLLYNRYAKVRSNFPTEQLSFQSSYFKNVDFSGRFVYSGGDTDVPIYTEQYAGLVTRTRQRSFTFGPSHELGDMIGFPDPIGAHRISVSADFGVTIRFTDKFRIVDNFRWSDFRIPGIAALEENSLFGTNMTVAPNVFSTATCPAPFTAATCPSHSSSSPADIAHEGFVSFLGQDTKINTIQLEYDFTRRVGARLGYRFRDRVIRHGHFVFEDLTFFPATAQRGACNATNLANGSAVLDPVTGICQAEVEEGSGIFEGEPQLEFNEHSGLFGLWARPNDQWRFSFDVEMMSADNVFTRIMPRNRQQYKFRTTYKPQDWISLGFNFNILEQRNNVPDVQNRQHYRYYGFFAAFIKDNWGLDLGYNFTDIFSTTNICYVYPVALGTANSLSLSPECAIAAGVTSPPSPTGNYFFDDVSTYNNDIHYGSINFFFKPVPRVRAGVGYTLTSSAGSTLILNPVSPQGPLGINYHLPSADLSVELTKRWMAKGVWNYYGYNEKSDAGFTLPGGCFGLTAPSINTPNGICTGRDVRGNVVTLSLRYAF
ncbi:MAG TPA: hypothetical protein VLE48_04185 [Terriglobales bacterium]|nr:hypothetical protein [Terriglobales bacterium]